MPDHCHRPAEAAPVTLPEIDAERCVQTLVVEASCRACVDACPGQAWILDENGLSLDTAACDACAICIAACPQSAIALPRPAAAVLPDEPALALLACEKAVVPPGGGVVPCLHAFDLDALANLHRRGVRTVLITRPGCADCPRGTVARFDDALAHLAVMLAEHSLPSLQVQEVSAATWTARQADLTRPSRRSLFTAFRPAPAAESRDEPERAPAALQLARGNSVGRATVPWAVTLDPARCDACDACSRICPTGAITMATIGSSGAHYAVDSRRCSGCRMCIDVCQPGAVDLRAWQKAETAMIDLDTAQCSTCGNLYRIAKARSAGQTIGKCRICAATQHNRNLFQVLQ